MSTTDVTRRAFVRRGALAMMSFGLDPLFLDRAVWAGGVARGRTLVCLFQRGAVDGLSMVVPHGDPEYYADRPRIAVPRSAAPDLDGHFGLHPALRPLMSRWQAGELAVIHAVGSPDPTRSHFDAQDYLETGTPGVKSTRDGWINRYCQHHQEHTDTPFRAVAFGPQLPRALAGSAPSLAIDDLQAFGLRGPAGPRDRLTRAFEDVYQGASTGVLSASSEEAFEAVKSGDIKRFYLIGGCDGNQDPVEKGRAAVKEVVTQPFNTVDSAKNSLRQSEDKQKAALEEADKEIK